MICSEQLDIAVFLVLFLVIQHVDRGGQVAHLDVET